MRTVTLPDGETVVRMRYVPDDGPFEMGSESDEADDDEAPQHEVDVDPFWMDETEVTNEQFAAFIAETGHETTAEERGEGRIYTEEDGWDWVAGADWLHPFGPDSDIDGLADHPVVQVSWYDAQAFCEWRGARLPMEAEWERGARGTDARVYPWGAESPDGSQANFCDGNCTRSWADESVDDGFELTAPVGAYSPQGDSPYGLQDMAGNVWEWTGTIYDQDEFPYPYEADDGRNPDVNEVSDETRMVVRGGSWVDITRDVRAADRSRVTAVIRFDFVGFRCASPSP